MHSPQAKYDAVVIRPAWPKRPIHPQRPSPAATRSIPAPIVIALALAIGLPLAGAAEAQTDQSAVTTEDQGTVEDPASTIDAGQARVAGTVTEVFGNKFLLKTDDGQLLVTTGPDWYHRLEVRPGDSATVVGEYAGGGFDAFRIIDADGT
jgi:hypothetical protein